MSYAKIQSFSTVKLNNFEFVTFMTRFRTLFTLQQEAVGIALDDDEPAGGSETREVVAVPGALAIALDSDLRLMNDISLQSRTSDETARMEELDRERDEYVVYINATVKHNLGNPVEAVRQAAVSLRNRLKPYVGIQKLPNQQQTAAVTGMITDMRGEAYAHVTTLGLNSAMERLQAANDAYAALVEQRTQGRQSRVLEDSKAVRARMVGTYDDVCAVVYATNVLSPTRLTAQFIADVNALIDETNAAYNQRRARPAAKDGGEAGTQA